MKTNHSLASVANAAHSDTPGVAQASLARRIALVIAIVVPFAGLFAGMAALWGPGLQWVHLGLLAGMYVLTVLGITVGFHRLFTHRSFETNHFVQFVLGALGSMSAQGPLLEWVGMHRIHHQHSDEEGDPHSPLPQGKGVWGFVKGLFYSHLAWMFNPKPSQLDSYTKDLQKSRLLQTVSALFPLWVVLGLAIPTVIAGAVTGTWSGAFLGLVWGGLIRMWLVHHVTWSINSVCHVWGDQPYNSGDNSRNNALFGMLALGEGWHNTHHAFPTSARHGLRWWQFDASYWVIKCLAVLGLAWNVKLANTNNRSQSAADR